MCYLEFLPPLRPNREKADKTFFEHKEQTCSPPKYVFLVAILKTVTDNCITEKHIFHRTVYSTNTHPNADFGILETSIPETWIRTLIF